MFQHRDHKDAIRGYTVLFAPVFLVRLFPVIGPILRKDLVEPYQNLTKLFSNPCRTFVSASEKALRAASDLRSTQTVRAAHSVGLSLDLWA